MSLPLKIAFWATVAGQIILLLSFIAVKEDTLRSGTSVLLETAPVDPRSILQGDFVILDYKIAALPEEMKNIPRGERIYVGLNPGAEGVWDAYFYTPEEPSSDTVFISGTANDRGRLEFGIDTFFIPEGKGFIVDRASDVKVRVTVGITGKAVIEDLILDGLPFDPTLAPKTITRKEEPPPPPQLATKPPGFTPTPVIPTK